MAEDISGKIGFDTTNWKAGISQINTDIRTLESGFKAVAAGMDNWKTSADGLKARNDELNQKIELQKKAVDGLTATYNEQKAAAAANGDTTAKTASELQNLETKVNQAKEALAKSETEVRKNSDALSEVRKSGADGIFAKIAESVKPNVANFKSFAGSVGDAAKSLGTGLLNAAKNVASTVGGALVGALKGAVAAVGALGAAAGALAVKVGKEVVSAFGELEQNLGGSEAVFGEYAASIQKSGEEAYKNLGVSQSDYLATANKMGALFQGSGLTQQKSLEMTEQAMQRAADMASVMGIDMQTALDSVAGAAKGNFTMMDNLGVSMNATSIEAFAVSKGLIAAGEGAKDAGESALKLSRAQNDQAIAARNVEKAQADYDKILERSGPNSNKTKDAALALEKAQISLSAASGKVESAMNASDEAAGNWWKNATQAEKAEVAMQMFFENTQQYAGNFAKESTQTVSGSMGLLQASVSSFTAGLGNAGSDMTNLTQNVVDAFLAMVDNILPVLQNIVTHVPTAFAAIAPALTEVLPTLLDAATGLFTSILDMLIELLPQLIPVAVQAIMTIVTALIDSIPQLLDAAMQLIMGLVEGIMKALPELIPAALDIIKSLGQFLIDNLPMLIDSAMQIMQQLIDGIIDALPELIPMAIQIMVQIAMALVQGIPEIIERLPEIIDAIIEGFAAVNWGEIGINLLNGVVDGMNSIAASVGEAVTKLFKSIWDGVKSFFGIHSPSTVAADDGKMIMEGFQQGAQKSESSVLSAVKGVFTNIWNGIKSIFGFGGGNEAAEAKKTGQSVTESIGQGVTAGGSSAETSVTTLSQRLIQLFQTELGVTGGTSTKTLSFGESLSNGIAGGIQGMMSSAQSAVQNLTSSIINGLSSALGAYGGASTVTQSHGQSLAQGILSGLMSMASQIASEAQSIGQQVSNGIAQGIQNGQSAITSAARNAAQSALSSAKASLDIHSPSKVAADQIGLPYVQGIAQGITKSMSLIKSSVSDMGAGLVADTSIKSISLPEGLSGNSGAPMIVSAELVLREKTFADIVLELVDNGQGFAAANRQRISMGVAV
jgi:phage-related protein